MKMNKKGFTLIELLAIIVILAIIAVITVPIILNIIDNARSGAEKDSIVGYGKAVELAYTQYQYDEQLNGAGTSTRKVETAATDGSTIALTGDFSGNLKVDFDGEQVVCAASGNSISNGKIKLVGCTVNGGSTSYVYGNGKACLSSASTDCD